MSDERRDRLERQLDAVLRTLVAGEGPADLRSRVQARIGRPAEVVRWPVWAAAAAAALVIASIVGWWALRTPAPVPVAEQPRSAPSPSPVATAAPEPSPAPAVATVRETAPRPAAAARADDVPAFPPLPAPEPITLARLEPSSVELEPIDVKPLVVPDLAVTPLPDSGETEHERKE
jgi:hypothetical protein